MRALVQRVAWSQVKVGNRTVARTGPGVLVLLGVASGDTEKDATYLAGRTARLRIFEDAEGKMNLSVTQAGGEALVVPQFTLAADTGKGNRPGFSQAALPGAAEPLYERYAADLEALGVPVSRGVFGADMQVSLCNDGPVTLLLESGGRDLKRKKGEESRGDREERR